MAEDDPQINIRLKPDRRAILEAAAFVHDEGPVPRFARQIVEDAIDQYARLPTVKKALEARAEQSAVDKGKLSHLPRPKRRGSGSSQGATKR